MRISDTCFLNSVRTATGSALSCLASNSLMSESFLVTNSLISSRRESIDSGPVDKSLSAICRSSCSRSFIAWIRNVEGPVVLLFPSSGVAQPQWPFSVLAFAPIHPKAYIRSS